MASPEILCPRWVPHSPDPRQRPTTEQRPCVLRHTCPGSSPSLPRPTSFLCSLSPRHVEGAGAAGAAQGGAETLREGGPVGTAAHRASGAEDGEPLGSPTTGCPVTGVSPGSGRTQACPELEEALLPTAYDGLLPTCVVSLEDAYGQVLRRVWDRKTWWTQVNVRAVGTLALCPQELHK